MAYKLCVVRAVSLFESTTDECVEPVGIYGEIRSQELGKKQNTCGAAEVVNEEKLASPKRDATGVLLELFRDASTRRTDEWLLPVEFSLRNGAVGLSVGRAFGAGLHGTCFYRELRRRKHSGRQN